MPVPVPVPVPCGSGDGPVLSVVSEAEVDEPSEVESGGAEVETEPVGLDTDEADTAMVVGDEPGDGPFDHWPVAAVAGDKIILVTPAGPVRGEEFVVFTNRERLAIGR